MPRRFRQLQVRTVLAREVPVARGAVCRLLGLSLLNRGDAGPGLLIPRCRSVHTFGMRFALDLVFLDRGGAPISVRKRVPPGRILRCRRAAAVLELPPILVVTLLIMAYLTGYELWQEEDLPFLWKAWWILFVLLMNIVGFAVFWIWLLLRRRRTREA
jgi:hypothetical protein